MKNDQIESIVIGLLSPEKIIDLSYGEVTNPHTIDAGTGLPVKNGLMCQKIFGPVVRGVCACGIFHRGSDTRRIICPTCDVVLCDPSERRRRLGHIELAAYVVHSWYRYHIAVLLAIPPKKLYSLISCKAYMVIKPGRSEYEAGEIISTAEYDALEADKTFKAKTGGNLIAELLGKLNLKALLKELKKRPPPKGALNRLMLVRDLIRSGVSPHWMVMKTIPVLPPDLRPVISFDDGTMASSDVNELYARIINRSNRLKKFLAQKDTIELMIRTQRMLLQEAVDALIDNEKRKKATNRTGKKVLKSLSGTIEKKEGRIRRNLLGKRVDYSGRSHIVPGPELKLNQCGLPLDLAMDIFRPFVYGRLRRIGYAASLKHAQRMVIDRVPAAVDALEDELAERTVLLNRAPTLHRLGIQAFNPILIEGRAIRLHPFVCSGFNADFDGDQMGVHIPVTLEAQIEAAVLMMSVNNLLSPANGKPVIMPSQDIVLGIYYLTKQRDGVTGEGITFADKEDTLCVHYTGAVHLQAKIKVRMTGSLVETTCGRLILSEIFPDAIPFEAFNKTVKKKDIARLVDMCYEKVGREATVELLDKIKELGFKYATLSGTSFCVDDVTIPEEKKEILRIAEEDVKEVERIFRDTGLINKSERYNKLIDIWQAAKEEIADKMMETLGIGDGTGLTEAEKKDRKEFNSMFMMADSGARGSVDQISQVGGMRGLMQKTTGDLVEIPIKSNLREGLTYHEYLLAAHGARKGRADGALKTATGGYLTRRLICAVDDVIINVEDCGTSKGFHVSSLYDTESGTVIYPIEERITGKVSVRNILNTATGGILVKKNEIITKDIAERIRDANIASVEVRSPITCDVRNGICAVCYGYDLTTKRLPEIGDAVGIIAAQSIGEPGTQLTLRTFHSGGSAAGKGKQTYLEAKAPGKIILDKIKTVINSEGKHVAITRGGRATLLIEVGKTADAGAIPYGATLQVESNTDIDAGETICVWDPYSIPIVSKTEGVAKFLCMKEGVTFKKEANDTEGIIRSVVCAIYGDMIPQIRVGEREYTLPIGAIVMVKEESHIKAGDIIARIPKEVTTTADITKGLPQVLRLVDMKKVDDPAIMAEIAGEIKLHPPKKGAFVVEISGDSETSRMYYIPMKYQLNVDEGDFVKAGDFLVDGVVDVRDILRIFGAERAASYIIDEVQRVYRNQGVDINDKHLEILLRKMLGHVQILNAGDSDFVRDEIVSKDIFLQENKKVLGKKAIEKQLLLSLTQVALHSESWLSRASYQNTTSILANAALRKCKDPLSGIRENVIVGNMPPVGTGHSKYRNTWIVPEKTHNGLIEEDKVKEAFSNLWKED